jgi:hypothetical protein
MPSPVVRHLVESACDAIIAKLQTDLPLALSDIRANRADNLVTMEPPRDYYVYPKAQGYRTPAVFVIGDRIDFMKAQHGANHVNAAIRVNVTVLVEDKDAERLMRKSYRYQAAMHQVLDQAALMTLDNQARLTLVVQNASFSALYSNLEAGNPNAVFRQEIALELDVYDFEQL